MVDVYKKIVGVGVMVSIMFLIGMAIFVCDKTENPDATQNQNQQKIQEIADEKLKNEQLKQNEEVKNEEPEQDKELKKQIGQMLMIGFRGTEISENSYIVNVMKDLNIGGVILFDYDAPSKSFPRNIIDPDQTKNLIADLKKFSPNPLFVAVDAEGGIVNRLKEKYGFIPVPSAQELGEKDNPEETKKISAKLARQLSDLGFNMNFAPVVDVNINPENPVIGGIERSFSSNPEKVVEQSCAFIDAHSEQKIITCIKHFPGHGSSQDDSHLGMVDITNTYQDKELIPFEKIIEQKKTNMVMTAHIINKDIDSKYPATLSPLFIQNILREKLGFNGVIVSDDMQMGAITERYGFDDAIIRAVNAGCDLLIISNNGKIYDEKAAQNARDIIFQAVKQGKISKKRIAESYSRILILKKQFDI